MKQHTKKNIGILLGLGIIVSLVLSMTSHTNVMVEKDTMNGVEIDHKQVVLKATAYSPQEYYEMFQCPCCGRPIDAGCCGMAEQRKEFLDNLLAQESSHEDIMVDMVKQFDFEVLMNPEEQEEAIKSYMENTISKDAPKIKLDVLKKDLGIVRQRDGVVSTTFPLKNVGKSDLVISALDTSCMCTTASIIYDGRESPIFEMSMHGNNPRDFSLAIPPGKSAKLKVYFDPNAHGAQKEQELKIIREIYISSNDPIDFRKKVKISLIQTP